MTGQLALADLDGGVVDLLGLGIDICALIPHLGQAAAIRAWVDDPGAATDHERSVCDAHGVTVGPVAQWPGAAPIVVRAPGFPRYRADIAPRLGRASVTTPLDLWLNTNGGDVRTVLITGTKGKSTVATMLAALLPGSRLCGNIGIPIWAIGDVATGTTMVIEMSSYQAADTNAPVDLAVLTSLGEDHISWHGSVERYHADKLGPVLTARRILTTAAVLPLLDARQPSGEVRALDPEAGIEGFGSLPPHMAGNAGLARAAARWLADDDGVATVEDPVATLLALPPLPGRLRPIATSDGRRWIDDALASNPSGAAAAVSAFAGRPIWLIVGGVDRRVSLEPLIEAARDATRRAGLSIVALPDSGPDIVHRLKSAGVPIEEAANAGDVAGAVAIAGRRAAPASVVLFSPAAPTPPRHGTWADRSDDFVAAVEALEAAASDRAG